MNTWTLFSARHTGIPAIAYKITGLILLGDLRDRTILPPRPLSPYPGLLTRTHGDTADQIARAHPKTR